MCRPSFFKQTEPMSAEGAPLVSKVLDGSVILKEVPPEAGRLKNPGILRYTQNDIVISVFAEGALRSFAMPPFFF